MQRQHRFHALHIFTVRGDQPGKPAGCHRLCVRAKLREHTFQDAVHQADVAVIQPDLDVVRRVGADDFGWLLYLDARQSRCTGEQRLGRDAQTGSDRTAQKLALARDHVEGRRGAQIHHDRRAAQQLISCYAVHDAIRAGFVRVVGQHRHPGLHAGFDKHRAHVKRRLADAPQRGIQRRHHRGDRHACHVARLQPAHPEQRFQQHGDLIGSLAVGRCDAPIGDHLPRGLAIRIGKQAHHCV